MKNEIKTFVFSIVLMFFLHPLLGQAPNFEKPQIAILGTFHFAGTSDYSSVKIDSLFSTKRQNEIEELVKKIEEFGPTKVLVESLPGSKQRLDSLLQLYLNGLFDLPANEIYQIGFRIAANQGLKEIYPIDFKLDMGDEHVFEYLQTTGHFQDFQKVIHSVQERAKQNTLYLAENSLLDYFKKLNSEEYDNWNRNLYLENIMSIKYSPGNPLAEYASNWYKRNLFMMGNIDAVVDAEDRILVIVGAGHRAILKELYQNRSNISYIEISKYFK